MRAGRLGVGRPMILNALCVIFEEFVGDSEHVEWQKRMGSMMLPYRRNRKSGVCGNKVSLVTEVTHGRLRAYRNHFFEAQRY